MRYALAAALLVAFVLVWQGVASLDSVDDLTLASPVETWQALRDDWGLLMDNAGVTLVEVLLGLALSVVAGALFAVAMHLVRPLRDAATRCWSGRGDPDRRARPAVHPRLRLRDRPQARDRRADLLLPDHRQPARRPALRPAQAAQADAQHGRLAAADAECRSSCQPLPSLFSGLKIAATVSVIGAVFGEWAGADEGLGDSSCRQQPAPDPSRLRGDRDPDPDGGGPVRLRRADRARGHPGTERESTA